MRPLAVGVGILAAALVTGPARSADEFFAIQVVDDQTGRGVPLVELETTNAIRYVTDSNGLVAFREPGLMGQKVFFTVRSHGYEFAKDGFGYRGKALDVKAGGRATLKIKRINIAERLYRVTGGGIYRDSVLLGEDVPIERPTLDAKVLGSDSVVNAVYHGKLHWFWGDTNRPAYPLGLFDVPGAVSELPSQGGLDPEQGVNLSYYTGDDGFARATAPIPGPGPTWIGGLTVLNSPDGRERMFASFVKIKPPLTTYARGLVEWNGATSRFEKITDLPADGKIGPDGHPFKHKVGDDEFVYFARPYPTVRVRATPEHFMNVGEYEVFTCLADGSTPDDPKIDRTSDGVARYSWKKHAPLLGPLDQKKLIDAGTLKDGEGLLALRDRNTGKSIVAHGGSVYWNEHRKRWVMIFVEGYGGPSFLGEVWYAEGDTPAGPWVYAVKVATHDRYDFYNPKQHPEFDKDGGRTIFFEGTYTNTFSGHPIKTPRYDYNQMMYKLDLTDPRLALPVPFYRVRKDGMMQFGDSVRFGTQSPDQITFFALDRAGANSVPIFVASRDGAFRLTGERPNATDEAQPLFYALSADMENPPKTARPLYEFIHSKTGERTYSTDEKTADGYHRSPKPLCLVWENPIRFTWPGEAQ